MRDTYTLRVMPYTEARRISGEEDPVKAKLTVTVDEALIPVAKRFARGRGLSLSQLIENSLREAIAGAKPSFSERWRGKLQPADRDDERFRGLAEKYLA